MRDVLDFYVRIKAAAGDVYPFLVEPDKLAMWGAPAVRVSFPEQEPQRIEPGAVFGMALAMPGSPALEYHALSVSEQTLQFAFTGAIEGTDTWHILPADGGVVVHNRVEFDIADPRLGVLWALVGRWGTVVFMQWLLRRLKMRVEDTVGSSTFGVPLLVSPFALATLAVILALFFGLLAVLLGKKLGSHRRS